MNRLNKLFLYALAGFAFSFTACDKDDPAPVFTVDFEDVTIPSGADTYHGQDKAGENMGTNDWGYTKYVSTYTSGNAEFPITYFEDADGASYWNGVAVSKQTDNTLTGPAGQFVAMPGGGADGSAVYAIMNGGDTVTFEGNEVNPQSIQLSNNAYAYHTLKEGNQFSKKFGGVEGNDPDYFKVIITGLDAQGNATGSTEFYLADFRFEDNTQDYIVDSWETVDLSSLGTVSKLAFSYESSDAGEWGINTPLYVAMDKLISQAPALD